ncbi:hypothetical protein OKR72_18485 [Clostridioides difficile]|nr:hypothetical protein [Clostridioides difficile]MCW0822601.1 hypothetical protein [Clostridioides difficile]
MGIKIGVNDIGLFLLFIILEIFFLRKYFLSKHKKNILFLLICIYTMINRKYMFTINGIAFNTTIYAEIIKTILLLAILTVGLILYKQRNSLRS